MAAPKKTQVGDVWCSENSGRLVTVVPRSEYEGHHGAATNSRDVFYRGATGVVMVALEGNFVRGRRLVVRDGKLVYVMDYSILARVLVTLSDVPLHLPTIASMAGVDTVVAVAALHVLSRRGLAVLRHSAYVLPAGMTPSQAQVVLLLGERGALSVSELALSLGRQDPDMHADLLHLAAMGRVEKYGGAWQLACGMSAATARAIAFALDRRHDLEGR